MLPLTDVADLLRCDGCPEHSTRTTLCSMSGLRRRLKGKKAPKGWESIEEAIEDFEQQMTEAVDEEHEGKRKAELTWKIHRIHWEKNRFIYDLMYVRKAISRQLVRTLRPSVRHYEPRGSAQAPSAL